MSSPIKKLLIITLAIFILALTACASQPTPEPVTITFAHQRFESDYVENLVAQFNEIHPEITIELTEFFGNQIQAQPGVDVFQIDLFSFLANQPRGAFLDLSPLIEQDQSLEINDFFPGALDVFTMNGKVWAIPNGVDPFVMYYNRELFDQYGVTYPTNTWTWDDLQTTGMLINDPDNNVYGFAVPEPYFDMIGMVIIHQRGGQLFDDLYNPTALTYNRPENIAALEWYSNLYHLHGVAPTNEQARAAYGGSGVQTLFRGILTSKIAMWPGNFSDSNGVTWPVEWDFDYGMVTIPADTEAATSGFATGYAIAADSLHPEAAWKWVNFLSKQVPLTTVPARKSLATSDTFSEQIGAENAAAVLAAAENLTLISPDIFQFAEDFEYFHQALVEIVNGTLSAEDALNWAQDMAE